MWHALADAHFFVFTASRLGCDAQRDGTFYSVAKLKDLELPIFSSGGGMMVFSHLEYSTHAIVEIIVVYF